MKTYACAFLMFGLLAGNESRLLAQNTAFTYQGRLNYNGAAASGVYDFRFKLYADALGGTQVGTSYATNSIQVTNGLFVTTMDFGSNVFSGASRWLEVDVRTNGSSSYAVLSPLQGVMPTPYAISAANVSGTLVSGNLSGVYASGLTLSNPSNSISGTFTGDGTGVTNVNASHLGGLSPSAFWQLGGNVVGGGQFLGSQNNQPVTVQVNGAQALQLYYASNSLNGASPNFIGGNGFNSISNGVVGATIGGGGSTNSFIQLPTSGIGGPGIGGNSVLGDFGTVPGGFGNVAGGIGSVAAGVWNFADGIFSSSIGFDNHATAFESVALGSQNESSGFTSFAIGYSAVATNSYSVSIGNGTIANGQASLAMGQYSEADGDYSVAIGNGNRATGQSSLAMGDQTTATGTSSTAFGYSASATGDYSTAMGYSAHATNSASFVWADNSSFNTFSSTANDQVALRAQNGMFMQSDVGIHLNAADRPMIVRDWDPFGTLAPSYKQGIGRWGLFMEPTILTVGIPNISGRFFQVAKYDTNGNYTALVIVDQSGNMTTSGTVTANGVLLTSDRNVKDNIQPVSCADVLDKVAALPVSRWNYKSDKSTDHIGPMAQDFQAAFKLGSDDRHISVVDEGGVALAAIQGLNQKLQAEVKEKDAEISELQSRLNRLEQMVDKFASREPQ